MKQRKRIIAVLSVISLLGCNAFAETTGLPQVITIEHPYAFFEDGAMRTGITDLAQEVRVYKYVNGQPSIVYTGPLDAYENGAWSMVDFSECQFFVIFDWNSEDTYYYIEPVTDGISYMEPINPQHFASQIDGLAGTGGVVTTNMCLMYQGRYYENVLMPNEALTVPISVSNSSDTAMELIPYIAQYDLNGRLIELKQGAAFTAAANSTTQETITETLSGSALSTAKIFLWEKQTLAPMHDAISIQMQAQDYFADTFEAAQTIVLDKPLCGVINTSTDIDIIKIVPEQAGLYAVQLKAGAGTVAGLYDATQSLIKATTVQDNYLFYELAARQTYYIRLNGVQNDAYTLTPAAPAVVKAVLENVGTAADSSAESNCDVFAFTPTADGTYIITAVGGKDVQAHLYNDAYAFMESAQTADEDVRFRITTAMQANRTYYILVSSKTEVAAGDYMLYVEQPLDVVDVW